jgi:adenylate cyclase
VLLGAVLPGEDRIAQPIDPSGAGSGASAPGLVAHAQALRSGLGRGLVHAVGGAGQGAFVLACAAPALLRRLRWRLLAMLAVGTAAPALGWALLAQGGKLSLAAAALAMLLSAVFVGVLDLLSSRRSRRELQQAVSGYLEPAVLEGKLRGALPPGTVRAAVLFADLRGYSAWAEGNPPAHVLAHTSRWHTQAGAIIRRWGGIVDNFRGDGLLAVFGAPHPHPAACTAAGHAARELQALARGFTLPAAAPGGPCVDPARIHIGASWGELAAGEIGSPERRDYSVAGDVVNVAARLQEQARSLDRAFVASAGFVLEQAREGPGPDRPRPDTGDGADALGLEPLGELALRGHSPVDAYGSPVMPAGAQ